VNLAPEEREKLCHICLDWREKVAQDHDECCGQRLDVCHNDLKLTNKESMNFLNIVINHFVILAFTKTRFISTALVDLSSLYP
jgi:hypothetical protein